MPSKLSRHNDRKRFFDIHDPDEYVCPDCGRSRDEHGGRWEVHHIDGEPTNYVGLCVSCHAERHAEMGDVDELESWKRAYRREFNMPS